jgi:hypothetical protein
VQSVPIFAHGSSWRGISTPTPQVLPSCSVHSLITAVASSAWSAMPVCCFTFTRWFADMSAMPLNSMRVTSSDAEGNPCATLIFASSFTRGQR